jgi:hypothetical protein
LLELLDHGDPLVRVEAIPPSHATGAKTTPARPAASAVLPKAVHVLTNDPDPDVRAYAVELVGRFVHTHMSAEQAIVSAAQTDVSPAVRKKARWYAPGGTIHTKTQRRSRTRIIPTTPNNAVSDVGNGPG